MSAPLDEIDAIAVATIPCAYCDAEAGQPCEARREAGGPMIRATYVHETRTLGLRAAYAFGYVDARNSTRDEPRILLLDTKLVDSIVAAGRGA